MAINSQTSTAAINAEANAVGTLLANGYLRLYGNDQPATADLPALADPLAELRFAAVAFHPASDGLIESFPLTADLRTQGSGPAKWFRTFSADGTTAVFDGSVGTEGCNLNLTPSNIVQSGGELHIESIAYRVRSA